MSAEPQRDWTIWLHQQRRILVNLLTGITVILGSIGLIFALISSKGRFSFQLAYYIGSYLLAAILFFARRLSDTWRSYGLLGLIYIFGLFALYSGWLAGGGRIFLLALVATAGVLVHPRAAVGVAILGLLTYIGFGLAFTNGWMPLPTLGEFDNPLTVTTEGVGLAIAVTLVIGSVWYFGRALMAANQASQQAHQAREQMLEHARELEEANALIAAQAEQLRSESESRFRVLFHRAPVAMVINRVDGGISEVNDTFLEIVGYTRDEVIGKSVSDLGLWVDANAQNRAIAQMRRDGRLAGFEFTYRRKSGETGRGAMWAEKISIAGEDFWITSTMDITERERALTALRESEEKFRNIIQRSTDAIVLSDEQGIITDWNQAAERLTGMPAPQVIGREFMDIQIGLLPPERRTPETIRRFKRRREDARNTGTAPWLNKPLEGEIQRQDGTRHFFQQVSFPIPTEKGFKIASVIRDITERKLAEMEREALIAALEAQNAELERFTYTVSHDLKSPLVTIRGFIGYLEQDARAGNIERMEDDIERITRATDMMERLLEELLELSRIGRKMNPPTEAPFAEIARDAVALAEGRLRSRGVQVTIDPDLPSVFGDRIRLVEVVQNLVDNAAKFMGDQPEPRIQIGARQEDDQTVFFVRDNGIGIDPRFHDKVFGLFDKLDAQSEGTGVGLALVKRIVEVHGGRIWIESQPGQGATFCFTLTGG